MGGYRGNTFCEIERALRDGHKRFVLSEAQMRQVIAEQAALIEKNNELVRREIRREQGES